MDRHGPGGDEVISVRGLTVGYGGGTVLEKVDFSVAAGEVFLILGESGCGKSTLVRHVLGLERPLAGTVTIRGLEIGTATEAELDSLRRRVGVLFQSGALFGSLTLFENVAMPLLERTDLPPEVVRDIVRLKLGMVELSRYDNYMPSELSGGMRKRAGIARAMVMDPEILFLDEPTAGLDPITAAELDRLMQQINRAMGTTLVIVTQDLPTVLEIGTRCIVIGKREKGIIARGDPRELRREAEDPRVSGFFNREPPPSQRQPGRE